MFEILVDRRILSHCSGLHGHDDDYACGRVLRVDVLRLGMDREGWSDDTVWDFWDVDGNLWIIDCTIVGVWEEDEDCHGGVLAEGGLRKELDGIV